MNSKNLLEQMGFKVIDCRTETDEEKVKDVVITKEHKILLTQLISLYNSNPNGFIKDSNAAIHIREIGSKLNSIGGFKLMLAIHLEFKKILPQNARNLEMVWDGLGNWAG